MGRTGISMDRDPTWIWKGYSSHHNQGSLASHFHHGTHTFIEEVILSHNSIFSEAIPHTFVEEVFELLGRHVLGKLLQLDVDEPNHLYGGENGEFRDLFLLYPKLLNSEIPCSASLAVSSRHFHLPLAPRSSAASPAAARPVTETRCT